MHSLGTVDCEDGKLDGNCYKHRWHPRDPAAKHVHPAPLTVGETPFAPPPSGKGKPKETEEEEAGGTLVYPPP